MPEIVCGTNWIDWHNGRFEAYKFTDYNYLATKCAAADLDGDGKIEIVLSEGDPCIYGRPQGGRLCVFHQGADPYCMWDMQLLEDHLLDAHTLCIGDVCGNGRLDIVCGEVGKSDVSRRYLDREPRLLLFENNPGAGFTRHVLDEGTGIHEGCLCDLTGNGTLDIIGKPLHGAGRWNIYAWLNER